MNLAHKSIQNGQWWKIPLALALICAAGLASHFFIKGKPFDEPGEITRLSSGSRMRLISVERIEAKSGLKPPSVQIRYAVSEFPDPEALITTTSNIPVEVHEAINLALQAHRAMEVESGTITFTRENAASGMAYITYSFTSGDRGSWSITKSKSGELWP